jgi:AraC-like DNA-binding protein
LSDNGQALRLNVATVGKPRLGAYQSELEILVVTMAACRLAAGPDWVPAEISLAYRPRECFPDIAFFAGTRIVRGTGATYLTIPRELMELPFPRAGRENSSANPEHPSPALIPESFGGLVQLQIEHLLPDRAASVEVVAESLGLSSRSLQRRLLEEGLTYSRLLADIRALQAAAWLCRGGKPIVQIALDLGYTDPSNFTRAFRRRTGVSPAAFRDAATGT